MDDVTGVGPAEVVFAAVKEFLREVEETNGLVCQRAKSKVFSWDGHLPPGSPEGFVLGGIDVEGQFAPGLLVYGVPVGSDLFVIKMLDNKVKEIEANAEKAIDLLSHDKQALWTVLRSSIQHQFDYWLMLVPQWSFY